MAQEKLITLENLSTFKDNLDNEGYIKQETDPTVPSWAKAANKPTYTASEVGLGKVGNFKAVSTEASQGLSDTEKANARANIGAGTSSFSGNYSDLSGKPTLGTAAAKDVPTSGNASTTQVVMGNDTRLTDSRTPTAHTHTKSEITDFPSLGTAAAKDVPASGNASTAQVVLGSDTRLSDSRTPKTHTHGNIQNGGALQTTDITIASGDKLVVTDSSDSAKVARTSVAFDGSTATKCLTQKGTWESFSNNAGTVTSVKVGTTSYNPSSGVVSLPAYPTTLPASNTTSTYSSTGTAPVNGKAVAAALNTLPSPMVFKGSLGTGGTITALPVNGTATIGDTYKVITAGTYASQAAKVGDMFICDTKTSSANTWVYIPSADEPSGTVTSITLKATSPIAIDNASAITTSGTRTLSHANSGATAGSYGDSAAQTPAYGGTFKVPYVTVNATGHVTAISEHTVKIPASDNTDTKNTAGSTDTSSKIFLIGATSQAANPQTYSHDTAYVGTDGCLYSGGTKVLTSHQDISGKVDKSGDTMTGDLIITNSSGLPKLMLQDADGLQAGVKMTTQSPTNNLYNLDLGWDWAAGTGSGAAFRSKKWSGDHSGAFVFYARNSTSVEKVLLGTATGKLTWDGKSIARLSATPTSGQVVVADGTSGLIKTSGYTIAKSVPSDAVFTDTKNTTGSTDTSSKIFLVGATTQAANSQTYSDNELYVTNGTLTTKSVQLGGGSATLQYNSTTSSIDFVFA